MNLLGKSIIFCIYLHLFYEMGVGTRPVVKCFERHIFFEQEIECKEIIRDSCAICITVCAFFFVIVFSFVHSIPFSSYLEQSGE